MSATLVQLLFIQHYFLRETCDAHDAPVLPAHGMHIFSAVIVDDLAVNASDEKRLEQFRH
eukprot:1777651-Amphidinium_carterae.1